MTQSMIVGIDLGKNWFHVVGVDHSGATVFRKKLSRLQLAHFAAKTGATSSQVGVTVAAAFSPPPRRARPATRTAAAATVRASRPRRTCQRVSRFIVRECTPS